MKTATAMTTTSTTTTMNRFHLEKNNSNDDVDESNNHPGAHLRITDGGREWLRCFQIGAPTHLAAATFLTSGAVVAAAANARQMTDASGRLARSPKE